MGTHLHEIQEFCLKWNNHHTTLVSVLDTLLEKESLCDVTLAAEGQFVRVHRFVLFACSSYFEELLSQQGDKQPAAVVFLKDVKFADVKAIVDFMYKGQVNVSQLQLESFLQTAEALQIKGLADKPDQNKYVTDMATKPSSSSNSNPIKQSNGGSRRAEKRPRTSSSTFTGINKKSQQSENSKQQPPCPPLRLQRSRLSTTAAGIMKTTKQTASTAEPVIATTQQEKKKKGDALIPVVAVVQIEKEECVSEEEVIDDDDDDEPPQLDKLDWITSEDNNQQSNEEEDEEDDGSCAERSQQGDTGENGADSFHAGDGTNGGLSILEDFEDVERPFVCPRCSRRYKRKNNAVSHLRHECGIEPSFPCPICSHLLSQRRYIQKHIRRKHPQYLREYEEQLLKQRNNTEANQQDD